MSAQTEAERLADGNEKCAAAWLKSSDAYKFRMDTAAELRRLEADNKKLRDERAKLAEQPAQVEVCCGDYGKCMKPCTPRGKWLAERPAQQEPETKDVVINNMGRPFTVRAYVTPQAQPAPEIAIADAYRAGVDSGIAAEREACAQVCDELAETEWADNERCAAAIRARSNT